MLGLILQSLKVRETHVVRDVLKKVASVGIAVMFFACALAWATTTLYIYILQWLTPIQAGLSISGSALLLGLLSLFIGSIRRPQKKVDDELIETLIAALGQVPSSRQHRLGKHQGSPLPEAALIAAIIGAILYGKSRG
jgi:hypothetical protein